MWDQASGEQKVTGGRDVVSGFVPKIRELQQRHMQQEDATKNNGEHQSRLGTRRSDGRNHSVGRTSHRRDVACNVSITTALTLSAETWQASSLRSLLAAVA